jgi:hypothetical protein
VEATDGGRRRGEAAIQAGRSGEGSSSIFVGRRGDREKRKGRRKRSPMMDDGSLVVVGRSNGPSCP